MSVSYGPVARFRRWCSSQYLRISPLHWEFPLPLPYSSLTVSTAVTKLSLAL